jgi:hypothetical protein
MAPRGESPKVFLPNSLDSHYRFDLPIDFPNDNQRRNRKRSSQNDRWQNKQREIWRALSSSQFMMYWEINHLMTKIIISSMFFLKNPEFKKLPIS